uniref:MIP07354p n=1 Tax=Drosophila melanogaster TaxID=7227 RepID=C0PV94_DROME|nr:MIP07354p [Drosophila melanogaster]
MILPGPGGYLGNLFCWSVFLYVQWRHFHACAADANVTKVSPVIVDGRGMSCTWSVTEGAAGLRQKSVAYSNENSWGNSILPVSITN